MKKLNGVVQDVFVELGLIDSGVVELKPGWYVRPPYPMTEMEMARYRFDPITLLIIAGVAVSTVGIVQQGKAAEAQGKSEADILAFNAAQKEKDAEAEREAARKAGIKFEREGERLLGTQRVQLARGGVLATEGTPALLLEETAQELEEERIEILKGGFARAEFRESEAFGLRFQGASARARGRNLKRGSQYAAGGTLLTGLGAAGFARSQLRA